MTLVIAKKCTCGGTLRVAPDVSEAEEEDANQYEDAAIFRCDACGARIVDHTSNRPDRYRRNLPVPDQSVFE